MREIAHTDPGNLPPFINFSTDADTVKVSVRSAPAEFEGVAVCGVDCTPYSPACTNYCGRMTGHRPRRAAAKTHLRMGSQASIELPIAVFEQLVRQWLTDRQETAR